MIDPNNSSPSGKRVTLPEDDLRARGNAQRRVLVPPKAVSGRTLKMLEEAAANFKKGVVSPPIDLSPFLKG